MRSGQRKKEEKERDMAQLTRRNFVQVAAAASATAALAACGGTSSTTDGSAEDEVAEGEVAEDEVAEDDGAAAAGEPDYSAPDASAYPIDVDGDDVAALYEVEELRDGWTRATNPNGVEIGVMDAAKIIQVGGLAFRDMNGDGKLDLFEDWRQSWDDRAADLASKLTAEECIQLMWHGGPESGSDLGTNTESGFDWIDQGSRGGVSRLSSTPESFATDIQWINSVQKVCEESVWGIPYINSCDPYVLFDVPSSIGLAAAMDKDLWRKAGMWQARAWRAAGVTCELGPQIDVYSNPIGTRTSGSVCEDPAVNRDFAAAFGGGMQSTWGDDEATDDLGWGKQSVGVMLKHFAGAGAVQGGRNDHMDIGKWNIFPGGNFEAHLIPFLDGGLHLDSKTEQMAALMPCYGVAYDPNDPEELGEYVGSAYSEHNISIVRNTGWDGMITTDWHILDGIPNGVRNIPTAERYKKLVLNTVDQHGGTFEPELGMEAYQLMVDEMGEDEALATVRASARRIFKFMLKVQLFDQPYSDRTAAKEIFESEAANAFGLEAAQKSVIMLKNKDNAISSAGIDGKVYIPQRYTAGSASVFGVSPASIAPSFSASDAFDVVTDTIGEASGEADADGNATWLESDIQRLTADELADVKYAIVGVNNPNDVFQGVLGGATFLDFIAGSEGEPVEEWKPLSLQYRPFTADGDYVLKESLNPVDPDKGEYENRSVYGNSTYVSNENDLDLVIAVKEALPTDAKLILVVNADRPMCFHEIEPYADAILLAFGGVTEKAFASIIAGEVEPSGLLPFQMPSGMQTVFEQLEDVPRDMECYTDSEGNTYDFTFGLNWSGKIDDERVATYNVAPLTTCETEVIAD